MTRKTALALFVMAVMVSFPTIAAAQITTTDITITGDNTAAATAITFELQKRPAPCAFPLGAGAVTVPEGTAVAQAASLTAGVNALAGTCTAVDNLDGSVSITCTDDRRCCVDDGLGVQQNIPPSAIMSTAQTTWGKAENLVPALSGPGVALFLLVVSGAIVMVRRRRSGVSAS